MYPWIQLVFDASVNKIAVVNLQKFISVDPGPKAHLRFSDRIPRGPDYAVIERLSYAKNHKSLSVRLISTYKCLRWIQDVYIEVLSGNKILAREMNKILKEEVNFKTIDKESSSFYTLLHCIKSSSHNILDIFLLSFSLVLLSFLRRGRNVSY